MCRVDKKQYATIIYIGYGRSSESYAELFL